MDKVRFVLHVKFLDHVSIILSVTCHMDLPDMLNSEAWNDMSVETEKKDEFSIFHDPLE